METDDLIRKLAGEVKPVAPRAAVTRLAGGLATGIAAALLLLLSWLGLRTDLGVALTSSSFWMKAGYTISLAAIATVIAWRLAHPESRPRRWYLLLMVPVLLLAGLAAHEISVSEPEGWRSLVFGMSAGQCAPRIVAISIPVFAGFLWAFRRFAPTQLRSAGAAAGLAAGAIGAALYALYCREVSASFVLAWYSLGISLPAVAGALFGPKLLRW